MPRDDLAQTQSQLGRLKRWKLKLDRLQPLEVQVENSFIKFLTQNSEHPLRIRCTRFWLTLRDSPELAMECQNSLELGASLEQPWSKLGAMKQTFYKLVHFLVLQVKTATDNDGSDDSNDYDDGNINDSNCNRSGGDGNGK